MKINTSAKIDLVVRFNTLKSGEVFMYSDNYFMRLAVHTTYTVNHLGKNMVAIWLLDGALCYFDSDCLVTRVTGEFVVGDNN